MSTSKLRFTVLCPITVLNSPLIKGLKEKVTLADVKEHPKLATMALIKKGQRLSIQRVARDEYEVIRKLGGLE